MIEESEFHLVLLFYLCLNTQFSSLSDKEYVKPKCCHFTCCYALPPSLDIEPFPFLYFKSRTSRAHMLNLCFHCLFLHTCFSTKQREVSACLYSRQHDKSLNTKLLCVAFEQCSAVLSSGERSTHCHLPNCPWWVYTIVRLSYLQPALLPQLGQWLWIPAALRSLGVTYGPGSLHPRGLLLRSLVRALSRNVPSTVTAGDSPLPSPRTAGHRYGATSIHVVS